MFSVGCFSFQRVWIWRMKNNNYWFQCCFLRWYLYCSFKVLFSMIPASVPDLWGQGHGLLKMAIALVGDISTPLGCILVHQRWCYVMTLHRRTVLPPMSIVYHKLLESNCDSYATRRGPDQSVRMYGLIWDYTCRRSLKVAAMLYSVYRYWQ